MPPVARRHLYLALLLGLVACGEEPRPTSGSQYSLMLVVESPRHLTPERERALAPVSDTGVALLRVERMSGDTGFGSYSGPPSHFWPLFRGIGNRFHLIRHGAEWRIVLDPDGRDAGMELEGRAHGDTVRGRWRARTSTPAATGRFLLAPAS